MAILICSNCGAKNRVDESRADRAKPVCGRCGAELGVRPGGASHPITVTDATFSKRVLSAGSTPVLVDFWAPWCGPCRALAPTLEQIAAESNGRYIIAKLNTDENPRIAGQYKIDGIPAMLIFQNGKLVDQLVGLAPKKAIENKLRRFAQA